MSQESGPVDFSFWPGTFLWRFVFACTGVGLLSCSTLHVHAQVPAVTNFQPHVEGLLMKASYHKGSSFALRKGSLLPRNLVNGTGSLEALIRQKVAQNPGAFLAAGSPLELEIVEFELVSKERWLSARSSARLRAIVRRGTNAPREFFFEETIDSHVTDTVTLLSTVSLVGWLWYAPYLGFRGTIVDQLDYLGRRAIGALLLALAGSQASP